MIIAIITMVDGDKITMPFESWATLSLWMDDHIGMYTGIEIKLIDQERRI